MDYSFIMVQHTVRDDQLSMTFELAMQLMVLYSLGMGEPLHMSQVSTCWDLGILPPSLSARGLLLN